MEVSKELCDFCARELRAEFKEKYPDGKDWKDGMPLWDEYRKAQEERKRLCALVAEYWDDFAIGDGYTGFWMCAEHLQEALWKVEALEAIEQWKT
jgi:hypothetical protein